MFNKNEEAMKKLVALFAVLMLALAAWAGDELNYVVIEGKNYFSEEVKVGMRNIRMTTDEGLTLKVPLKKVDAYMVEGKIFERQPLICCDGKVKRTALLELVAQRNGLRLYKLHSDDCRLGCCFLDKNEMETIYLVYKEGNLHVRVNETNAPTLFEFFRVPCKIGG